MELSSRDYDSWVEAGRLAAEALSYGASLVRKGASVLDAVERIDRRILDSGAQPAFPSQISLDSTAAHFCPDADDETAFSEQLAKIDIGVSVEGCVADNALTVDLSGRHQRLVEAAERAVEEAVGIAVPGTSLDEIGRVISGRIQECGFVPIRNLTGHGVGKFEVHTYPTVPNCPNGDSTVLEENQVIAIEPFATSGEGFTTESGTANVFMLVERKPVRLQFARDVLKEIESYQGLPFTRRWLYRKFSRFHVNMALAQLVQAGALEKFPPLVERSRGLVSQAEHTVIVREEPVVITRRV